MLSLRLRAMSDVGERIKAKHALSLMSNLFTLWDSTWGSHYEICGRNKSIYVHRLILAAFSPRFKEMLDEAEQEKIHLDIGGNALDKLVHFMYEGKAEVNAEICEDLLQTADRFDLEALMDLCSNFLRNLIPEKPFFVRRLCKRFQLLSEIESVDTFIVQNYAKIKTNGSFESLKRDELVQILNEVDLSCEDLWDAIWTWGYYDVANRAENVFEIFEMCTEKMPLPFIITKLIQTSATTLSEFNRGILLPEVLRDLDRLRSSITLDNFTYLISWCRDFEHENSEEARKRVIEFIVQDFPSIASNENAVELSKEDMFCLFETLRSRKGYDKEMWIFLLKWTEQSQDRRDFFRELFAYINLQEFTPEFLGEVVLNEDLVCETPCRPPEIVARALFHHCKTLSSHASKRRKIDKEANETRDRTLIAVYKRESGKLVGLDVDKKSRPRVLFNAKVSPEPFQAAVNIDNRLYVMRGRGLKTRRIRMKEKKGWNNLKSLDENPMADAKMVVFQKNIYVIQEGVFWDYSPEKNAWTRRDNSKFKGSLFSVCSTDSHIYILGGDQTPMRVLRYDPSKPETEKMIDEIESMRHPRKDSAAVATQGKVYVVGGSYNDEAKRSMEYYNTEISSSEWVLITSKMKFDRFGFAACAYEKKIYAIGGKKPAGTSDSIEVYRISENESNGWEDFMDIGNFQSPFSAFVVAEIGDSLGETSITEVGDFLEETSILETDEDENSRDHPEPLSDTNLS